MKKVSALVVTYNRLFLLEECIDALLNQTVPLDHIVIIDNNSTDGTQTYLDGIAKENERIIYSRLDKNVGGAGGFYAGIMLFQKELKDDFVWIMDDDTIPALDALEQLEVASRKLQNFGFLASNVRWKDGQPALMNTPDINSDSWTSNASSSNDELYPMINSASFVSVLITRVAINRVGLPYKEFFVWGDDAEFTSRISKVFSCYFVAKSIVIHKMKENKGVNILEENGPRVNRYFYSFRNRTFRARKVGGKKGFKMFFKILIDILKVIFSKHVKSRGKKLRIMIKGLIAGVFFNPKIKYIKG